MLPQVGIDPASFGSLGYVRLGDEYSRSQQVAEAAHFLGFDGLIVPSARWSCANVIAFADRVPPEHLTLVADHGPVDWAAWRTKLRQRPGPTS